jgi:Uma2 family endonuclease
MSILARALTYYDLERAREATNDRLELIEGELFVTPAPSLTHQDVVGLLYVLFRRAVLDTGRGRVYLAPTDVRLAEKTFVQPDLLVVLSDRAASLTRDRIVGAPSLIAEVVSPSSAAYDNLNKRELYARHHIPEYWIVDHIRGTITVYGDPRDGRYHAEHVFDNTALSLTIPGLSIDLHSLFASAFDE